ncbi:MAG TPA: hypothetical protein VKA86_06815 [Candidatus Krumholzibacteria bacterium]|nr:hypothetical protein [Candidatus Krumholzibacteria bacterium]
MNHTLRTAATLAVLCSLLFGAASVGAADATVASIPDHRTPLRIAPYDRPVVQTAIEAQAWVVLSAARDHARAHEGRYPTDVDELTPWLPRGERMRDLWTGELRVPTDDPQALPGTVVYRPIVWEGHSVGGEVIALGPWGETATFVSDLGWWKRTRELAVNLP